MLYQRKTEDLSSKEILVLDDDVGFLKSFRRKLVSDGYPNCTLAKSIAEAHKEMEKKEFDLLLVDIYLDKKKAKKTGLDFIHDVRGKGFGKLVMVVSGYSSCELFIKAANAGANDYWVKMANLDICDAIGILMRRLHNGDRELRPTRVDEICFFKCIGCKSKDTEYMQDYYDWRFPSFQKMAEMKKTTEHAIKMRFSRIYKKLGIKDHEQLVEVLTACSLYRK